MARVAERSKLTPGEYLAWEREQPTKHEYFDGEVFAMAGGSPRHNALCLQIGALLRERTRSHGCVTLTSDQRVGLRDPTRYVYPDITVVCGELRLQPETTDVLTNPTILVEVLSQSTEQYDRGLKWVGYQTIPSLADYLLVSQADVRIEHFRRDGDRWVYRAYGAGERVELSGGGAVEVDAVYDGLLALPAD
ncbi:MAG TPA: Uma2 family endonuclease [Kofleriaceae bacterium]|nr:Uma2 family endonuclease [Kofleriaceae bacterium]